MKKLYLLIFVVILFSGCLIPDGLIKPELTLLKANQDVNAVKVQGELSNLKDANLKLADKIDQQNSAIMGVGNSVSKVESTMSAGRDIGSGNTNEKEIYIAQVNAQKEINNIFKYIIGALILLITRMYFTNQKFFHKYIFYKEQTFLRLNDDKDVEKIKSLQKGVK